MVEEGVIEVCEVEIFEMAPLGTVTLLLTSGVIKIFKTCLEIMTSNAYNITVHLVCY